jgi:hypothetical protein
MKVQEKKPAGMFASRSVLSAVLNEDYSECLKIGLNRLSNTMGQALKQTHTFIISEIRAIVLK